MSVLAASLFVASTLCPPEIVAVDARVDQTSVMVKNNCGSSLELADFALRAAVWSWNEAASVESGTLEPGECFLYHVDHKELDDCGLALGVFDVCADINKGEPLLSVSTGKMCVDIETDQDVDTFWWSQDAWSCISFGELSEG